MTGPAGPLADLRAESGSLDALVAGLDADGWALPTPAAGWTVAHQISHLAWTDRQALLAVDDPAEFTAQAAALLPDAIERGAAEGVGETGLLARWRAGRDRLAEALAGVPPGTRLPWFGPPMGAVSMATARLMETWAHGEDVAEALGVRREPTARLRHIAHLGVRTRDFAFRNRRLAPPATAFRVVLTAPDGTEWSWGPEDAEQSVTGPALDFCLLVTRRRHRADLALRARGADAGRWLDLAQAFAGPPGDDPRPAS